jgi:hypothetical protein
MPACSAVCKCVPCGHSPERAAGDDGRISMRLRAKRIYRDRRVPVKAPLVSIGRSRHARQ